MDRKPIIAVVGATGAQGGGLARAILEDTDRRFAVRALTRNAGSDKGRELSQRGAEVVEADLDDLTSVKRAFNGAHGAYCVTNFWEHFSPEKERAQAAAMARAAEEEGLSHAIWSTLEDTRQWIPTSDDRMPTLMGRYKVPHFDAKAEANREFTARGVPTTFLMTSFYWDNLIHFGAGPRKDDKGVLTLTLPMGAKPLPGIAAEDIGRCAYGIFKAGDKFVGKTVGIAGEHLTGEEMAAALTKALGQAVRYGDVPPAVYRQFGFPGAEDLGNMYQFYQEFNDVVVGARDIRLARELNPSLQTFAAWLERNKANIPLG